MPVPIALVAKEFIIEKPIYSTDDEIKQNAFASLWYRYPCWRRLVVPHSFRSLKSYQNVIGRYC